MKIADKIKIKDKEFMCTQILFLDNLVIYKMHEVLGNENLFMMENDNGYAEIHDKHTLAKIYNLINVRNTDVIIF